MTGMGGMGGDMTGMGGMGMDMQGGMGGMGNMGGDTTGMGGGMNMQGGTTQVVRRPKIVEPLIKEKDLIDPWNNPVCYEWPTAKGDGKKPAIWSCGPDKEDNNGEGDDIINWDPEDTSGQQRMQRQQMQQQQQNMNMQGGMGGMGMDMQGGMGALDMNMQGGMGGMGMEAKACNMAAWAPWT